MRKGLKIALSAAGLLAAAAVPIAVVACGSTTEAKSFSADDQRRLEATSAATMAKSTVRAPIFDIVQGKNLDLGTAGAAKNYLFFLGTTACPVCNKALTGKDTRTGKYSDPPNTSAYNGEFAKAAATLRSTKVVDEVFLWEDLAPGYGDRTSATPEGNPDNFPWSGVRTDAKDESALTFQAAENYFHVERYHSPFLIAVRNGEVSIVNIESSVNGVDVYNASSTAIADYIKNTYYALDAYANEFAKITSTSLTESAFLDASKTSADAQTSGLGITIPATSLSGVNVTITKNAQSADLNFTLTYGGKTASAKTTITVFAK